MSKEFVAGRTARRAGLKPIDNPHFAIREENSLFNEWSDGWMAEDDALADKPRWAVGRRKTTVGLTASWEQHG